MIVALLIFTSQGGAIAFKEEIILNLDKPKRVWVVTFQAKLCQLEGERTFAIVMNANSFDEATLMLSHLL